MFSIFKKRVPDYKKHPDSSKTLQKDRALFTKAEKEEEQYGGFGGARGLHSKKTKSEQDKEFYVANHHEIEYLVMEVLCQLGLNTPTTRFLTEATEFQSFKKLMATRELEGYIPMTALLDLFMYRNEVPPKALQEINKLYRLNPQKQTVTDLQTGQEYKISGNLFAANIAGLFVQDRDFQPEGLNCGVIKRGDRFFCVLIDKDMCTINGAPLEHILKTITQDLIGGRIFKHALSEQILAILDEISKLIEKKEDRSILEQIFLSARVLNSDLSYTPSMLHQMADDLKSTGESIISHFTNGSPDVLSAYRRREGIRATIADKVIEKLMLATAQPESLDKEALKAIIIEDLRAPYYQHLFKLKAITCVDVDNNPLINAIVKDQIQELIALEILTPDGAKKALATNTLAASEKLLPDFKTYAQTLLEQPGVKLSFKLKNAIKDLLTAIENDESLFENSPVDMKPIIKEMDTILKKHSGSGFWKSHQSPSVTWFNFKKEHAQALEIINAAEDIISSIEEAEPPSLDSPYRLA